MPYEEILKRGKRRYYYLVENIRVGKKFKKVKVYLGTKPYKKFKLKYNLLSEKVKVYLNSIDPLLGILTEKEKKELERIKKENKSKRIDWKSYYEWFVTKFTYNTNAIEGSTLSLRDTENILFEGIAPKGKTIREVYEVQNHKNAFDYMLSYNKNLTKQFVLNLHKILMSNILEDAGAFRRVNVYIRGVDIALPQYNEVEKLFKELVSWYAKNSKKYNPVVSAAYFHFKFESIHPFQDGNGRIGRLIINFMLRKSGYPMIDFQNKEKHFYYNALYSAQRNNNLKPLVKLMIKYLKEAYQV